MGGRERASKKAGLHETGSKTDRGSHQSICSKRQPKAEAPSYFCSCYFFPTLFRTRERLGRGFSSFCEPASRSPEASQSSAQTSQKPDGKGRGRGNQSSSQWKSPSHRHATKRRSDPRRKSHSAAAMTGRQKHVYWSFEAASPASKEARKQSGRKHKFQPPPHTLFFILSYFSLLTSVTYRYLRASLLD